MHAFSNSTVLQRTLVLVIPAAAAAWFLAVPVWLAPPTFAAVCGFLAIFAWVFKRTYDNAQPASSLAQSIHDVDTAASIKRAPEIR